MEASVIRQTVKQTIGRITGIPGHTIDDKASLTRGLSLDSLAMLEIAMDAEMTFRVIPEERLPDIQPVDDAVRVIREYLPVSVEI